LPPRSITFTHKLKLCPGGSNSGRKRKALIISFAVRLKFAPEDRDEVAESLRVLAAASQQEPGCINYIPHHLEDDPDTALIGASWKSLR
jgi:hypothetical protein